MRRPWRRVVGQGEWLGGCDVDFAGGLEVPFGWKGGLGGEGYLRVVDVRGARGLGANMGTSVET